MPRLHLFELHDARWFPAVWRDLLTDFLSFFEATFRPYRVVAAQLWPALQRCHAAAIVDLGSGAGQSVLGARNDIERDYGADVAVILTDKYPNVDAFRAATRCASGRITWVEESVDATDVPESLRGFRTLFSSFHHFDERAATRVLADAVAKRQGIGVFEFTERNPWIWGLPMVALPLFVWLVTPFMRPFRWRRLLWTYLVPVVPVVAVLDGIVSVLRSYSPAELAALTAHLGSPEYVWETGRVRSFGALRITFLLGWPRVS